MKNTSKTAIGGMMAALTIVIMSLTGILPYCTYALPAVASFITTVAVIELGSKWAWMMYSAVSFICLFLVLSKEAAMIYVFFFGYYPIIKQRLENRISRFGEWFIKYLLFNLAIIAVNVIIIYVFGIPLDETGKLGKYTLYILLGMANVVFLIYDIALTKLIKAYLIVWQPQVHKLFKC